VLDIEGIPKDSASIVDALVELKWYHGTDALRLALPGMYKANSLRNEKRYTMPVVLLKWYTIPPSVQGARTTLKENNSSVAKQ